jgi:hypothetical protein
VVTTKLCCVPGSGRRLADLADAVGLVLALDGGGHLLEVIPICARRSGFSQMRIAMSGTGNMVERLAPGMRLIGSSR